MNYQIKIEIKLVCFIIAISLLVFISYSIDSFQKTENHFQSSKIKSIDKVNYFNKLIYNEKDNYKKK